MTMPSGYLRNDYIGDGSLSSYGFDFKIYDQSHLLVIVADDNGDEFPELVLGTHYTVSGVGEEDGGNIALINGAFDWIDSGNLKTDYTLTILSNRPSSQNLSLRNQGPYYPEDIEKALDEITKLIKQVEEKVGRVITLPSSTPLNNVQIGAPTPLYFLRWNAAGDAIEAVATAASVTAVRSLAPTGLINNSNTNFTIPNSPIAGTFAMYKNGRRLAASEYSRTGVNITTNFTPDFGDQLLCDYDY